MLELENSNNARKALEADLHTGFRVPPDVAGRTKHGTSVTVTFEYLRPLALFIARAPEDLPRPRGLATSVQDLRDSGIGPAHILDLFVAGGAAALDLVDELLADEANPRQLSEAVRLATAALTEPAGRS